MLSKLEYLCHLSLLPDAQQGFFYPASLGRKQRYASNKLQTTWASGASDPETSRLRQRYEANRKECARHIGRAYYPIRSYAKP
jgi:hypothetical protein